MSLLSAQQDRVSFFHLLILAVRSSNLLLSGSSNSSKTSGYSSNSQASTEAATAAPESRSKRCDLPTVRKAASVDCLVGKDLFKSTQDLRQFRTKGTGSSLLHIASYYGRLDMVHELVEQHGLDIVIY